LLPFFAREGVDLDRAVMANWVGKSVWIAAPLVEAIRDHVMAAATPRPGPARPKPADYGSICATSGPHARPAPPAVIHRYSADRRGEHPRRHLAEVGAFCGPRLWPVWGMKRRPRCPG
jgi:transposase